MKKWKLDRIISVATLVTSVVALVLVLKRPAPVVTQQTPAQAAANAQSFQEKIAQLDQPPPSAQPTEFSPPVAAPEASPAVESQPSAASSRPSAAQVHITSDEITAALAQASGALPAAAAQATPGSDLGSMPNILDQQISFDGDQAHGQFLVNIAGKDVWITVSGHLGSRDGYATFEPTEFKVGDLNVPVSLVNGALQQRLAEQHDRMKLPDNVGGIKVENGQLVLTQK
jgi:type IV secretory pathway VirB10-like protein